MKKFFAVVLSLMLVLCGCGKEKQDNKQSSDFTSSLPQAEEIQTLEKYKGKEDYADISLGWGNFAQNDDNYYYIDFDQAYSVNKQTKEKTALFDTFIASTMFNYKDTMIFQQGCNVVLYDLKTNEKTIKPYPEEWCNEFHLAPSFYMVEDGFVMVGYNPDEERELVYFVDREIKNRKLLNAERCNFILDDNVFYLSEDGNVYCCDIKTNNKYYVTDYKATLFDNENPDKLVSNILSYIGKGKILAYCDEKLQIINLCDGSSYRPYTAEQEKKIDKIEAVYGDDAIYFMIWESEIEYRIDSLSYETLKPQAIYSGKWTGDTEEAEIFAHRISLLDCDDEYLYFEDLAQFEDGNHFRIKKDGSSKEVLFHHFGEEIYSIDYYE